MKQTGDIQQEESNDCKRNKQRIHAHKYKNIEYF